MRGRIITAIAAIALVASGYYYFTPEQATTSIEKAVPVQEELPPPPEPERLFGFNIDSFEVYQEDIKRNENLSEILSTFSISPLTIHNLALASKDVFDVRKIAAGRPYTVLSAKDSTYPSYFVYEKDPIHYVVYELTDSPRVFEGQRTVEMREVTATGTITSSLYETLAEQDLSPQVAIKLSEVYAWALDFYRLQKGDRFKLIYEEQYVEDEPVGIGQIKAAIFEHQGEPYYAFQFEGGDENDYYDENGKNLRKAFLRAPLKFTRISSRYTLRRFHPVQKRWKAHLGTDYAAPSGTPIYSVGNGTVTTASYTSGNGRYVKIRHNHTYTTQYLHMSKIAPGIRAGKAVKQGDVIGYVGSTGLATGPHLCFRFWKHGRQVDWLSEKIPPGEPVKEELMPEFAKVRESLQKELQAIPYAGEEQPLMASNEE